MPAPNTRRRQVATATALCLSALAAAPASAATAKVFSCKVWVVSYATAANVAFPAPAAAPDATFQTDVIGFIGTTSPVSGPGIATNKYGYTIGGFVNGMGVAPLTTRLRFSKVANPILGAAAGPATAMSGPGYGVMLECAGTVQIASGVKLGLLHDDGAALRVDGTAVAGITPTTTGPILEAPTFAGATGPHGVDILYANAATTGAWFIFSYGTKLY